MRDGEWKYYFLPVMFQSLFYWKFLYEDDVEVLVYKVALFQSLFYWKFLYEDFTGADDAVYDVFQSLFYWKFLYEAGHLMRIQKW